MGACACVSLNPLQMPRSRWKTRQAQRRPSLQALRVFGCDLKSLPGFEGRGSGQGQTATVTLLYSRGPNARLPCVVIGL